MASKKVLIRFKNATSGYNGGEAADFDAEQAQRFVETGMAECGQFVKGEFVADKPAPVKEEKAKDGKTSFDEKAFRAELGSKSSVELVEYGKTVELPLDVKTKKEDLINALVEQAKATDAALAKS